MLLLASSLSRELLGSPSLDDVSDNVDASGIVNIPTLTLNRGH